MQDNYQENEWYRVLSDPDKELLEELIQAQRQQNNQLTDDCEIANTTWELLKESAMKDDYQE